ncbi:MAG: glycosyltransferase family 4 protein [Candidatus Omnitrophota bacterium]
MKILIITTHLNPGGISRYVLNLSSALSSQNHTVWIASSGGAWCYDLSKKGVKHLTIPINTKSILSPKIILSLYNLSRFFKREDIDIIHCNTRVTELLGFFCWRIYKIPYVCSFHGFYRASAVRKLLPFSGLLSIAVSRSVKKHLIEDLNIPNDSIRVVYNGINTQDYSNNTNIRSSWGFKDKALILGILGRISEEKGHFLALEAFKMLCAKYSNLFLVFSGKGKLLYKLQNQINRYNLNQKVKIADCTATEFLSSIDILLVPSKKEGFGYSVIEAFVKGVPVIAYSTGGISEIIKHKQNGILFTSYNSRSLSDSIEDLIGNDFIKRKITAQAKDDSVFFSSQRMAIDTEKVYREVM